MKKYICKKSYDTYIENKSYLVSNDDNGAIYKIVKSNIDNWRLIDADELPKNWWVDVNKENLEIMRKYRVMMELILTI